MIKPQVVGKGRTFSASLALECIARALSEIRDEDHLTYGDLGAILGKSEDQTAKYCAGIATMDAITFARGKREWGSRFTGYLDRLCETTRRSNSTDHHDQTKVARAMLAFAEALEDGEITVDEVLANRATLEAAGEAITKQLAKLRPAA